MRRIRVCSSGTCKTVNQTISHVEESQLERGATCSWGSVQTSRPWSSTILCKLRWTVSGRNRALARQSCRRLESCADTRRHRGTAARECHTRASWRRGWWRGWRACAAFRTRVRTEFGNCKNTRCRVKQEWWKRGEAVVNSLFELGALTRIILISSDDADEVFGEHKRNSLSVDPELLLLVVEKVTEVDVEHLNQEDKRLKTYTPLLKFWLHIAPGLAGWPWCCLDVDRRCPTQTSPRSTQRMTEWSCRWLAHSCMKL